MGRWSQYDEDSYRLPEGMTRIGYDADTQTYTYRDERGNQWEGAPGNRYGTLRPVDREPRYPDAAPYLEDDDMTKSPIQVHAILNSAPKVPTDVPQEFPDTCDRPKDKDTGMSKRIAAPIQSLRRSFTEKISGRPARSGDDDSNQKRPRSASQSLQRALTTLGRRLTQPTQPTQRAAQRPRDYILRGPDPSKDPPACHDA